MKYKNFWKKRKLDLENVQLSDLCEINAYIEKYIENVCYNLKYKLKKHFLIFTILTFLISLFKNP